jgi:quinol monooxygenase YgiN
MCRRGLLVLATCLGSTLSTAHAEIEPAFALVLKDPQEQAAVVDAAKRSNVVIEDSCKNPFVRIKDQIRIEAAPQFDPGGKLISGRWLQTVFYAGCGVARTLNVLISVEPQSRPLARALIPGTTHADPTLQVDVFQSPGLQHSIDRWRDPACTTAYVDDTAFIDQDAAAAPGAREPKWREAWTIAACSRNAVVLVEFRPDATGTTFALFENSSQDARPETAH